MASQYLFWPRIAAAGYVFALTGAMIPATKWTIDTERWLMLIVLAATYPIMLFAGAVLERVFKLHEVKKNATSPPAWFSSQGRRSRSDERAVSQRFDRWTMASVAGPAAQPVEAWQAPHLSAADSECHLVRQPNRVSVASAAA
jgi:hypothetical protein